MQPRRAKSSKEKIGESNRGVGFFVTCCRQRIGEDGEQDRRHLKIEWEAQSCAPPSRGRWRYVRRTATEKCAPEPQPAVAHHPFKEKAGVKSSKVIAGQDETLPSLHPSILKPPIHFPAGHLPSCCRHNEQNRLPNYASSTGSSSAHVHQGKVHFLKQGSMSSCKRSRGGGEGWRENGCGACAR